MFWTKAKCVIPYSFCILLPSLNLLLNPALVKILVIPFSSRLQQQPWGRYQDGRWPALKENFSKNENGLTLRPFKIQMGLFDSSEMHNLHKMTNLWNGTSIAQLVKHDTNNTKAAGFDSQGTHADF